LQILRICPAKALTFALVAALAIAAPCGAQISWSRTFGGTSYDFGTCAHQSAYGGYIMAGTTWLNETAVYLVRTDLAGDTQWTDTFYSDLGDMEGNSVIQTPDGNEVVAGTQWYNSNYSADGLLLKFDPVNEISHRVRLGGDSFDYFNCIRIARDGNYIIAGQSQFPIQHWRAWLVKTDTALNFIWEHLYGDAFGQSEGYDVWADTDGGYSIAATIEREGSVMSDVYLVKTDAAGETLWSRTYGSPNNDRGYSHQQTSDRGYIVAGQSDVYQHGEDVYLIRTNSAGDTIWTRTFGGFDDQEGRSVRQTHDGGFIVAGWTNSGAGGKDVYLLKTDADGNEQWSRMYGGTADDAAASVEPTDDGGYIVAGTTSSFGAGSADAWLIKTDANGNVGVEEQRRARFLFPSTPPLVSPNPFVSRAVLRGHEQDFVTLYDISCRKVGIFRGDRIGEGLPPGVYFLHPEGAFGKTLRVVKLK
jgi:hypothetical protein